jgi:predicted RNA binding protein YcfA (HicA-like mRNA interferase family)
MQRKKLIQHLEKYGCYLLREGGNHSIFINPKTLRISTVPRHREIKFFIAQKICKDLEISLPEEK